MSGLKQDNTTAPICVDKFKNTDGREINRTDLDNICNTRRCITKCCKGKDTFYFMNLKVPFLRCYNKTMLSKNFNKTVEFDYSVKVFDGTSEADAKLGSRNLLDYYFVHNLKVMRSKCTSSIEPEPQSLYIFKVSLFNKSYFWD